MKHWFTGMVLLLLLLSCGSENGSDTAMASSRVSLPPFNANRAFQDLHTQVKFGPRIPGTDGHVLQLPWMVEELSKISVL